MLADGKTSECSTATAVDCVFAASAVCPAKSVHMQIIARFEWSGLQYGA